MSEQVPGQGHMAGRIRAVWKMLLRLLPPHSLRRSAFVAFLFVCVTEIVLHESHEAGLLAGMERTATDAMMAQQFNLFGHVVPPQRLALLDADNATWQQWERPSTFPKRYLLPLIKYACDGEALAIIVDVQAPEAATEEGKALAVGLRQYCTDPTKAVPLIMAVNLAPETSRADFVTAKPSAVPPEEAWPIRSGSALIAVDDDNVVRRWRLWETECSGSGAPRAIPSLAILALAALSNKATRADLDRNLRHLAMQRCAGEKIKAEPLKISDTLLDLVPRDIGERVLYSVSPADTGSAITTVSAGPLVSQLSDGRNPAFDPVRGRIVIIGASADEAGSWLTTPIGRMPGMYVLANAVITISRYGNLHPPSASLSFAIGIGFGMLIWALLEVFQFSIALALSSALVWLVSLLLLRHLLASGVWIDAFFASCAIVLHRWFFVIHSLWSRRGEYGWRVLLSPRWQNRSGTMVLVVAMLATGTVYAGEMPEPVARIVEMPGLPSEVRIIRKGSAVGANYQVDLLAGDRIEVLGAQPLILRLADQSQLTTLRYGDPLFTVPAANSSLPTLPRLVHTLYGWLGLQKATLGPRTTSTAVRGGAIRVPALAAGSHLIGSGRRSIPLLINGGTRPFYARVIDSRRQTLIDAGQIAGERFDIPSVDLAPGPYTIEILDIDGLQVRANFDVVSADEIPPPPKTLSNGLTEDAAATITAAWLASQENGAWALEAMVRARQLEPRFEPAAVLLSALLRGRVPDAD